MDRDPSAYEGLVFKTAHLFHEQAALEFEDMCQELRMKIVKARRVYDPTRSRMTESAFVYACLHNFVKELQRTAIRRRRLSVTFIEDDAERLTARMSASHDEIYGMIERGQFVLPSTITPTEKQVLLLLVLHHKQPEIAAKLGMERTLVARHVRRLREKLADWRPTEEQPADELVAA